MMPHMLTMTALQIRNPVPLFILMKSDDRLVHVTRSLWYISRTILRDMVLRRGAHEGLRGFSRTWLPGLNKGHPHNPSVVLVTIHRNSPSPKHCFAGKQYRKFCETSYQLFRVCIDHSA